jgi:hypothetical protein
MGVSFLVPYRASAEREPLFEFALDRIQAARVILEDLYDVLSEVIVSDDRGDDPALFNHGQAINRAASLADGHVLAIVDADTTFSVSAASAIAASLRDGNWRLPRYYRQLTRAATSAVIANPNLLDADLETEWVGEGVSWSGIVVVPRFAFDAVGGSDERYRGWGADDVALGLALNALYRPVERWEGSAFHLWHPRGVQEAGLHRYCDEQIHLTRRYQAAAERPREIEKLLSGKRL